MSILLAIEGGRSSQALVGTPTPAKAPDHSPGQQGHRLPSQLKSPSHNWERQIIWWLKMVLPPHYWPGGWKVGLCGSWLLHWHFSFSLRVLLLLLLLILFFYQISSSLPPIFPLFLPYSLLCMNLPSISIDKMNLVLQFTLKFLLTIMFYRFNISYLAMLLFLFLFNIYGWLMYFIWCCKVFGNFQKFPIW